MKKADISFESMMKVGHIQVSEKFTKKWDKKIQTLKKKYKIDDYVDFDTFLPGRDVTLDCAFTLEQLEAIVKLLREFVKDRKEMYKERAELWKQAGL